ncbi:hypothetical protein Acr_23g0012730 [Actinidia rufa]|uniref:Uncharacterized protein n=1 Tax=Actinidia rufa TaxID=165716 RepID=A0A7J0GQ58_9ERIC|nr:hypothetical protein Acr_23g0012730 [Actinidia rufa]
MLKQCKEVRHPSHCSEGHCDDHLEGHSTYIYQGKEDPSRRQGVHGDERLAKKPTTTSACSNGGDSTGLGALAIKDTDVVIKLAQSSLLPTDVEMVNKMELDEVAAKQVREIQKGLEFREIAISSLKVEAILEGRGPNPGEALTYQKRVSVVTEFKASKEYNKVLTLKASRFYGEGFELCKKQIKLHFPDLDNDDMKIDPNLDEDGASDDDMDGDDILEDP